MISSSTMRKDVVFILILVIGLSNIFFFLMLADEGIRIISPPGSSGDTEVALGVMLCGVSFFIFIVFVVLLALLYAKIQKEYFFILLVVGIVVLCVLISLNIIVRFM